MVVVISFWAAAARSHKKRQYVARTRTTVHKKAKSAYLSCCASPGSRAYIWARSLGPAARPALLARHEHGTARWWVGPGQHGLMFRAVFGPQPKHVGQHVRHGPIKRGRRPSGGPSDCQPLNMEFGSAYTKMLY
jgi:hypothetical protein